jgi:hypothetical protein
MRIGSGGGFWLGQERLALCIIFLLGISYGYDEVTESGMIYVGFIVLGFAAVMLVYLFAAGPRIPWTVDATIAVVMHGDLPDLDGLVRAILGHVRAAGNTALRTNTGTLNSSARSL